ncbi:hypothetical protein [Neobacillus cucumis]|uniref:hypothetical protein n=1 Tax=Neobacillus cucumis TaxID=1740721 RepID=UPI002E1C53B1|nr:hypothetical protein [Neobacillus cucumis]
MSTFGVFSLFLFILFTILPIFHMINCLPRKQPDYIRREIKENKGVRIVGERSTNKKIYFVGSFAFIELIGNCWLFYIKEF